MPLSWSICQVPIVWMGGPYLPLPKAGLEPAFLTLQVTLYQLSYPGHTQHCLVFLLSKKIKMNLLIFYVNTMFLFPAGHLALAAFLFVLFFIFFAKWPDIIVFNLSHITCCFLLQNGLKYILCS